MSTQRLHLTRDKCFSFLWLCLSATLIFSFFRNIYSYSTNVPNSDDFDIYLSFLNSYTDSNNFLEKLSLLFSPHNEHILVFPRLLSLGLLNISGEVNFIWLNLIGCSTLLVIVLAIHLSTSLRNVDRSLLFLCVCLLLFHPLYAEATLWATASVSNLWVIGFMLLSLLCASHHSLYGFTVSVIFGFISTATLANGVFVYLLLGQFFISKKEYKKGTICLLLFGALLTVFLRHSTQSALFIENPAAKSLVNIFDYALTFIGSSLSFYTHRAGLFAGSCIILIFFYLWYLRLDRKNPLIFCLMLFCIITAFAQAISRYQINMDFAFTVNRYKFVSLLALVGIVVGTLDCTQSLKARKHMLILFTIAAALFCSYSYNENFIDLEFRKQFMEDSLSRWNTLGTDLEYYLPEKADKVLKASISKGIYKGLQAVKPLEVATISPPTQSIKFEGPNDKRPINNGEVISSVETIKLTDKYLFIRGWAFLLHKENEGNEYYLVLMHNQHNYQIPTTMRLRRDVALHHRIYIGQSNLVHTGFQALIARDQIPPGDYELELQVRREHSVINANLLKKLRIEKAKFFDENSVSLYRQAPVIPCAKILLKLNWMNLQLNSFFHKHTA